MLSFVIPSHNRQQYLQKLIDSIQELQEMRYEIIIIDDNSSDNTQLYCQKIARENNNVVYLRNKCNRGPHFNREKGFLMAKFPYVIFADDDDYYVEVKKLKTAVEYLETNNCSFYSFNSCILKPNNQILENQLNVSGRLNAEYYLKKFQTGLKKPLSTFTTVFRKKDLEKSDIQFYNDSSIYMRALIVGDAFINTDVIGFYRQHNNNITNNLNIPFVIANLEEKYRVYRKCDFLDGDWIKKQVELTLHYFRKNNQLSILGKIKLVIYLSKRKLYRNLLYVIKYM